jgi:hypothetical protein
MDTYAHHLSDDLLDALQDATDEAFEQRGWM